LFRGTLLLRILFLRSLLGRYSCFGRLILINRDTRNIERASGSPSGASAGGALQAPTVAVTVGVVTEMERSWTVMAL